MEENRPYLPSPANSDDSLSLRDLAQLVRDHLAAWRRQWKMLALASLLGGALLGLYAWWSPATYTGTLTYMTDNQLGRSGSFLTQFSSLLGVSTPGAQTYAQLTEIARSFNLISRVLLEKRPIDGRPDDLLANHLIRAEKFHENLWAPSAADRERGFALHDFYFTRSQPDSFSRQEQFALKSLYNALQGLPAGREQLLVCGYDDETGIMSLSFTSRDEALAAELPKALFEALRDFYLRASTESQARALELVSHKTDSLRRLLEGRERSLARFQDQDNALLFQEDRLPGVRLERDRQMLGLMYGEAVKNREIADFALQNATPALQVIDQPCLPLLATKKSPLQFAVLGSVLGAFLVCVFLSLRLLWREAS